VPETGPTIRIGVVGDVHLHWDDRDAELIDCEGYDLVAFVGDLAGYRKDALGVARSIARLKTPALVIPGNHDAASLPHLAAETLERRRLARLLGRSQSRRVERLRDALAPVTLTGYRLHRIARDGLSLSIIAARPHSQGGTFFAFSRHIERTFGVRSLDDSAARLMELVDGSEDRAIVFLAHNGPTGLGTRRSDIWGCDFRPEQGDWGDPDLRHAIEHARAKGKRVLAVLAGHMHHRVKGGGERAEQLMRDGTLYLNAARVPRIERDGTRRNRLHYCLESDGESARATLIRVPA
jgi:uncharacterized protein (TIGR04168 family)